MYLKMLEPIADSAPSAAAWIRSFPPRLVILPGERRTVRVLVTPPPGLAQGEYWARLVVATRTLPAPKAIPRVSAAALTRASTVADTTSATAGEGVQIGLTLEVRSLLGLFFRNGAVTTGIALDEPRTFVDGDSIAVRVKMQRLGNAAFVGSLRVTLRDVRGAAVAIEALPLGVYYDLDPRVVLRPGRLAAGRYTVLVEAIAARPDVSASLLLPIAPARRVVDLVVPDRLP